MQMEDVSKKENLRGNYNLQSNIVGYSFKEVTKVKRIILDSMKDHLISHIIEKMTCKKNFEALVELFQGRCASQ